MINLIVACSLTNVIGKDNTLPWKLSSDLKRFKELTTNNVVIMGRKTYESIGKPLPKRTNIVISRQENYTPHEEVIVRKSLEEAIETALAFHEQKEIFIIGGGQIYNEALTKKLVDRILLTKVFIKIEGDTFFPELNKEEWQMVSQPIIYQPDEKNQYLYSFEELIRK